MPDKPVTTKRAAGVTNRMRLSVYVDEDLMRRVRTYASLNRITPGGAGRVLIEERLRQIETAVSAA